jgi:hypothetical protein
VGGFPEIFEGATLEDMICSYRISREAKIRYLHENGIGHHFSETISGYVRQQYRFGRDTVMAYWTLPEMLKVETHQGRIIYLETAITGLTMLCAPFLWPILFLGLAFIVAMNIPLIAACFNSGGLEMTLKAVLFIPVRDSVWAASFVAGIAKILLRSKCLSRQTALEGDRQVSQSRLR